MLFEVVTIVKVKVSFIVNFFTCQDIQEIKITFPSIPRCTDKNIIGKKIYIRQTRTV